MRIKLDENLPAELAEDLRALGHDTDSVASEGLVDKPDTVIAYFARQSDRVLVTLDKGLGDIRRFPPKHYRGIVLFRLGNKGRTATRRIVLTALARIEKERRLSGRLLIVSESSIRFRQ